jgi:hypothetical protein
MPGVWTVDFGCRRPLDIKKPKGRDGARFRDEGYDPAPIQLVGQIQSEEDWAKLQTVMPKFRPRTLGRARTAIEIDHPSTALLSISLVYVVDIKAPVFANGIMTVRIEVLEYVDAPKAVPKSSKPPEKKRDLRAEDREHLAPDTAARGP